MRKVVRELLEPTVQRSHVDRERINVFEKQMEEQTHRLKELEDVVLYQGKNVPVYEQIYSKLNWMQESSRVK